MKQTRKNTTRKTKKMSHGAYSSLAREEGEVEGAVMLDEEEESCEHHHQLNSNSTGGRAVGPYRMCIVWCPIPVLTYVGPHLPSFTSFFFFF
jgi:hypothetical protein